MTRMKLNQTSMRQLRAMLRSTELEGFGHTTAATQIRREITNRQRGKRTRMPLLTLAQKGGASRAK